MAVCGEGVSKDDDEDLTDDGADGQSDGLEKEKKGSWDFETSPLVLRLDVLLNKFQEAWRKLPALWRDVHVVYECEGSYSLAYSLALYHPYICIDGLHIARERNTPAHVHFV